MISAEATTDDVLTFDVIVVGAGPAGATTAYYLAHPDGVEPARRVALLEKERLPRDKICGDAWCAPALDILEEMGVLQKLEADGLVRDCTSGGFISPSGESYVSTGEASGAPGTRCYAIKRTICDERIARRAAEVGAMLREEVAVERAELESDGLWSVHCRDGSRLRARMLVAADGATSRLARSLAVVDTPPLGVAARQYVRAGTHNFKSGGVLLYPSYMLPGYVALFRHYDDVIDLGAYVIPGGAVAPDELLEVYRTRIMCDPFIRRVLGPEVEFLERVRVASLRTGGVPRSTARQFMAVGDAAGQTDPLTGEGIHTGMIAGRLAARTIHELFARGDFSAEACEIYHQRWMTAFGRDFAASAAGGRMSYRFPVFLDAANVVAQRKGDAFMVEFGAAMTGVKPKTTFAKPSVALPLMAEVMRQLFLQRARRAPAGGPSAYEERGRACSRRETAFENACLRDPAVGLPGATDELASEENAQARQADAVSAIFRHAGSDPARHRVLVLYGSEYGFAQELADRACASLAHVRVAAEGSCLSPRCVAAEHHEIVDWAEVTACLLICSTAGDGVPPQAARGLFAHLESAGLDLSGVRYSVLALGDRSYPNFCRAGRELDALMAARGAQSLSPVAQVDCEDTVVIDAWLAAVTAQLADARFWLPEHAAMGPERLLERARRYFENAAEEGTPEPTRARPVELRLAQRRALTRLVEPGDRETVHLELEPAADGSLSWQPGDALGVFASNCPAEVEAVLAALGRSGEQPVERATGRRTLSLRDALLYQLDIKRLKPELFAALLAASAEADERERIEALCNDERRAASYLRERELQDLLREFPTAARGLPTADLVRCCGAIAPRYYSLASVQRSTRDRLALAVAVVRYQRLGRERTGLASSYLAERVGEGDGIRAFVQHNPDFRPPPAGRSCVMIGAGTGVAPYRAFLQAMQAADQRRPDAPHLLFFGCRRRERDFLYADEWQHWVSKGVLEVFTAFSRDQPEKIYLQHRLREQAQLVWRRMEGGDPFYICGDAAGMAVAVEQALGEIVVSQGGATSEQASAYLETMRRNGRLQKDVWVV